MAWVIILAVVWEDKAGQGTKEPRHFVRVSAALLPFTCELPEMDTYGGKGTRSLL